MDAKMKKEYMHSAIAIIIMLFFRFLPAPAPITSLGMTILGIFIGCIYSWCTTSMIWSSILGLVLLGLTEYCTVGEAISTGLSNSTVQLIIFMLVFASIASISGLTDYIANKLMGSSLAKGRPWVLTTLLLVASYLATALVDSIPAILICWGFVYTICDETGMRPFEKWTEFTIAGIVFASCLGFLLFPFKVAVVANYGFLASAMGVDAVPYSYGGYMLVALVVSVVSLALYIAIGKFILRCDVSKLQNVDLTEKSKQTLDDKQKIAVTILIALIVTMLLSNFLPNGMALKTILGRVGTVGIALFYVGVACFIPYKGKKFVTFKELAENGMAWDLVFMIACALTLASALTSKDSGVSGFLMTTLTPVLMGKSLFVFIILFLLISAIMTNLINNVVVSAIMIPVMYQFSVTLGFNPIGLTTLFIFVDTVAMLLPSSSPSGAMMHGNKEWVSGTHCIFYGLLCMLIIFIVAVIIGIPIMGIIG